MSDTPQTDGGSQTVQLPSGTPGESADVTEDGNSHGEPSPDASEFVGEDVVVGYPGSEEPVIDGVTIRLPPGEVTALIGPNGSGKSTLLKGLADQLAIDAGTVLLDGEDVHTLETRELARKLGLLSQENVAPNSLTVEDLVSHGRYPHRGFFDSLSDADREAIDEAIELAGVDHLRDRSVGSLSGGQRQLVWIAMVLAQDTDVLLLDEPTTFLDMHHQLEVMEIVERLRDESDVTVGLVLHDIEQAARYADHVVALKDGTVRASGDPEAVLTESLLRDVFAVDASVATTDRGLQITPVRPYHG
ncbi:Ferric enterobactin transport protein [Halorhabdus tiamatea SARL4B]|uniref:Cobalamin import ATP-binding protein BtuD n=1 Tax=Halorhabdus tiamatea SARL4B TaxID=1033806 RepID=F7PF32_9EURY|nr:ABC transporter ATP-binding protein [Halorhabdus tiamatea]ERJ06020.1 Ferric enterobactin transport protein [Halorhabdus tiamatea SARL4B]CCQ34418.1 ferrichrome ABC transporter, ATP-binding protein [Halorhabdus tiamatea SARL4B]